MQTTPWYIEMLGGLRARTEGGTPVELPKQQTGALLAYLALQPNRLYTREELAALIWPEDEPETTRQKLRQTLYALRGYLEQASATTDELLLTTRAAIQLNPALLTTDLVRFDAALRDAARTSDISERVRLLSEAVNLYRGELLPGFYQEEFVTERHRLAESYRNALHDLSLAYAQAGDFRAIETGHRALALDPLAEEAHCDLMRLYAAAGQPSAVLRQYQELTALLKKELNEEPSPATRQLMESLRQSAQTKATASGNGISSGGQVSYQNPNVPDASNEVPFAALPVIAEKVSSKGRGWLRSAVTVGGIMLCLLLTWQTVGRQKPLALSAAAPPPTAHQPDNQFSSVPTPILEDKTDNFRPLSLPRFAPPVAGSLPIGAASEVIAPSENGLAPPRIASALPARGENITTYSPLWIKRYEARADDKTSEPTDVVTDANGNIYITGLVNTKDTDVDFLTIKYDRDGNLIWEDRYNGPGNDVDRARCIVLDDEGNVYVAGESDNGQHDDPRNRLRGLDIAIIKYDKEGHRSSTWPDIGSGMGVRRYNGPDDGEDWPIKLLVEGNNLLALGKSWGRGKPGKDGFDIALIKYDRHGNELWPYRYDGEHGDDVPANIVRDRNGDYYVAGGSIAAPANNPESDMLILKISNAGEPLWDKRYGENNLMDDHAYAVGLDGGGNIYVIGMGLGAKNTQDASQAGGITVKYAPNGKFLWARGTTTEVDRLDRIVAARVSPDGMVVIIGMGRNSQGKSVCRTVMREANGQLRWSRDFMRLSGNDGPAAFYWGTEGIYICGGIRHSSSAYGFYVLQYNNPQGKQGWQHILDPSFGHTGARAITLSRYGTMVVGHATNHSNNHIIIAKYRR